jgi:hypothetical protein
MPGLSFFLLFRRSMPKYPALVIAGGEVRKDGLTSDTACLRIPDGLHLGRGGDNEDVVVAIVAIAAAFVVVVVVVVVVYDEDGGIDVCQGFVRGKGDVGGDDDEDDASLSIVPLS